MNRRGFFAVLLAPFVARFIPKRPLTVFEFIEAKFLNAQSEMTKIFATNMYLNGRDTMVYSMDTQGIFEMNEGGVRRLS